MSLGEGEGGEVDYEVMQGRNWPSITQFSVFLENRVGQLLELVRAFQGSKVRIAGLSISDSADCCIVRLILSHPEQGREILALHKLPFAENEVLLAEMPNGSHALVDLCVGLIQAEINIHYAYPLIIHPRDRSAMAMHVDNIEQASVSLHAKGFEVLCEADLQGWTG